MSSALHGVDFVHRGSVEPDEGDRLQGQCLVVVFKMQLFSKVGCSLL